MSAQGDLPFDLRRSPGERRTAVAQLGWRGEGEAVRPGRRLEKGTGSLRGPCNPSKLGQLGAGRGEPAECLGLLEAGA